MRGKHVSRSSFSIIARIPPAHAGKSQCDAGKQADCRDHPRACGENSKKLGNQFEKEGSSPRMRGKRVPAFAAKDDADHPRACGENLSECHVLLLVQRSSPRMRGKPLPLHPSARERAIIPAHAGKTKSYGTPSRRSCDHPRACGENPFSLISFLICSRSSQRMRGKHFGNGVFPWLILVLSLNPL